MAHSFQAISLGLGGIKNAISFMGSMTKPLIDLNQAYEKTQKNIASLIALNHSNVSSLGRVVSLQENTG